MDSTYSRAVSYCVILLLMVSPALAYDCDEFIGQMRADCFAVNGSDELVPNLIYTNHSVPDHEFVKAYNDKLNYKPKVKTIKGVIYKAWFDILTITPSIQYHNLTFVPSEFELRTDYNYEIKLPEEYTSKLVFNRPCMIKYSLDSVTEELQMHSNGKYVGNTKRVTFNITDGSRDDE